MLQTLLLTINTKLNPFHQRWVSGFNTGMDIGKLLGSKAERIAIINLINDLAEKDPESTIAEYPLLTKIHETLLEGNYGK